MWWEDIRWEEDGAPRSPGRGRKERDGLTVILSRVARSSAPSCIRQLAVVSSSKYFRASPAAKHLFQHSVSLGGTARLSPLTHHFVIQEETLRPMGAARLRVMGWGGGWYSRADGTGSLESLGPSRLPWHSPPSQTHTLLSSWPLSPPL